MTKIDLQKWGEAAASTWISEYTVPWVAFAGPHSREMAAKWMKSKNETIAAARWQVVMIFLKG